MQSTMHSLLESSPKSQQVKEFLSETKPFELSNEDFPLLLPEVHKVLEIIQVPHWLKVIPH